MKKTAETIIKRKRIKLWTQKKEKQIKSRFS
jgi:hypothetical protein